MRITDHHIVEMAAASAVRNESRVGELAQEVSSGLRVSKPSDDPSVREGEGGRIHLWEWRDGVIPHL